MHTAVGVSVYDLYFGIINKAVAGVSVNLLLLELLRMCIWTLAFARAKGTILYFLEKLCTTNVKIAASEFLSLVAPDVHVCARPK